MNNNNNVYLSPSTQEFNQYVTGTGSEEYYMNLVADDMVPYLEGDGINVTRNTPSMTVPQVVAQANEGNYALHLALHSNAAPESLAGKIQGPDVYYYQGSSEGRRAAEIIAENLAMIYPYPSKINVIPNTTFYELRRTNAPAVLVELAYHDNLEDANWIINNTQLIAENLSMSTAEYLKDYNRRHA